ncbi:translation elongation factor IF5A [Cryptococcus amylolentus CBS 6273]|uniref:Eukaryotic translation initiation factor 5A n=1 Tax=Cryptococcus amylolentus CBS 6273 TaxID=1296118 RepID=A0A1E3K8I7_9TREE|nr:translation elongation factor IF5A [Cryptococcus amylolentus CBS 6273]
MAHHPNNDTYPVQCSALKKSNYVVLHNVPCKITDISTKHGEAEVHIVGVDIFTGKKYEDTVPSTQVMQVPNVTHEEYLLASIDDDDVLVLEHGAEGVPKYIKLPPGKLGEQITSNFHMDKTIVVVVLGAMGGEQVVSQKVT